MTTSTTTKTRTTDSTDRTVALAKTVPTQSKTLATRVGHNARRFMNALMRSLASAHV